MDLLSPSAFFKKACVRPFCQFPPINRKHPHHSRGTSNILPKGEKLPGNSSPNYVQRFQDPSRKPLDSGNRSTPQASAGKASRKNDECHLYVCKMINDCPNTSPDIILVHNILYGLSSSSS
ncbi:hypothetical protein NPIL_381 [Nephila pilipes]|uniref:Uncharacterized protein n=1 Tax=Nephila pilipes TaxID=299642 RepID=A0A8X6UDU6_NEPPI|nr:hypothetical protein NPIL_381 [Nephila pilipes]